MAIKNVIDLQREYGFPIDSEVVKLASAISLMPFKDEEDDVKNSKDCSSLFKECKTRLLKVKGDTNNGVDDGEGDCDPLMQHKKFRLIEDCCKLFCEDIANDVALKTMDDLEFFFRRTYVEYIEFKKELGIRPDIWMGMLTDERELLKTYCGMFREHMNKASCGNTVRLLEDVKKTLLSCLHPKAEIDAAHATQAALQSVSQLGSHPFSAQCMSVDIQYISQVGSGLTGIPASWLSSSLMPPSPSKLLLKKFFGQAHAVAALENVLESSRDRHARPLGTFLFHDSTTLYWEDFAKDLSCRLYGTDELSLRLDLSADVDTLLKSAEGKGKLSELLDNVKKRPFSVVVLEKVDQAQDSVIDAISHCLTVGCTVEGTSFDFSRTVFIMVCNNCSSDLYHEHCSALPPLFNRSSRRLMDLASNDCGDSYRCPCSLVLKKVKDHLSTKIWDLLDDVVLFSETAGCCTRAYARLILREIAARFCGGQLIIYPSEAALGAAWYRSDYVKGDKDMKRWLEVNVVPTLQKMVDRNDIDEKSIVFIDTYVGTRDLSYRVEKFGGYLGDDITKNFSEVADGWRSMYVKGKVLEDTITSLRKRLVELCTVINANVEVEAISIAPAVQEFIEIVDNAIDAANDIRSSKEVLGCSLEKVDAKPSVSKKAKIGVQSLRATVVSHSGRPVIIEVVERALLRKIDASEGSKLSPSSYLLLGLEDDGKRELHLELERNFKDAGIHLLKINLSDYSKEESPSRPLACSPGLLSGGTGWLHLVKTVTEHPYSILYFDQVERASMSIFSLLMSLLVHGVSIDSAGNVVDFGRTVIIVASDFGNKHVMAKLVRPSPKENTFGGEGGGKEDLISSTPRLEELRFRSELVHKVDEVIVFDPFARDHLKSIARIPIRTEFSKDKPVNSLPAELSFLFAPDEDFQGNHELWTYAFSGLLEQLIKEGAPSGL